MPMFGAPRTARRAIAAAVSAAPSRRDPGLLAGQQRLVEEAQGAPVPGQRGRRRRSSGRHRGDASGEATAATAGSLLAWPADAPPAPRRSRGRARGARRGPRGRSDHGAGRGAAGHAVHRPDRRARASTSRTFDVEVLDVIDRGRAGAARILVRVSGPPIDATGLGPGFSGSPILCTGRRRRRAQHRRDLRDDRRVRRRTALATPIEAILAQPALPPAGDALGRSARAASPAR